MTHPICLRYRLATIMDQSELVLRLSAERLSVLEDALPLSSHFTATLSDLRAWLDEVAAEVRSIDVPHSAGSEQLRKLLDGAKVATRFRRWCLLFICISICLQCFDAVGWAAGRASGL